MINYAERTNCDHNSRGGTIQYVCIAGNSYHADEVNPKTPVSDLVFLAKMLHANADNVSNIHEVFYTLIGFTNTAKIRQ